MEFLEKQSHFESGTRALTLKEQGRKVKRYLIGKSKSAAYIFSEDEE